MYRLIRPVLFRLDPERAHNLTLSGLRVLGRSKLAMRLLSALYSVNDPRLAVSAFGLNFQNPVGLAAGYDKNAVALRGLSALGFGHAEVGTVTVHAQPGNPRPRIYRVPASRALINSMGFPNDGVDKLLAHLQQPSLRQGTTAPRLGINIGKGKDTLLEHAADEYAALLRRVYRFADYVTVNISSPNTLGLRQLQARSAVEQLLQAVTRARSNFTRRVPLLVKVAPDLSESELDDVLAAISACGVDGIVATNTSVARAGIPARYAGLKGGLSGEPLRPRSLAVVRYIAQQTHGRLPIVGVGGIASGDDALAMLRAGARLVQVYTGLVYAGPGLVHQINAALLRACERDKIKSVQELVASPMG